MRRPDVRPRPAPLRCYSGAGERFVEVNGKRLRVRHTSARRLRCVSFDMDGDRYEAIEQNPAKPSRWGQLARAGHKVVQFKDAMTNRFVAVAFDGKMTVYGGAK